MRGLPPFCEYCGTPLEAIGLHECGLKKMYATVVIDKDALEKSKSDKGTFVKLAQTNLEKSAGKLAESLNLVKKELEKEGAEKMLAVVSSWLNIEPIKDEIWQRYNQK